jgi:hypothetical protein
LFAEIVLALGALSFAGFGIWLLIAPGALAAVDVRAESPNGRVELRAMYGGLELGLALFLFLCLRDPQRVETGLHLQLLALAGLGSGRLVAIALERFRVRPLLLFFMVIELAAAAITCAALL